MEPRQGACVYRKTTMIKRGGKKRSVKSGSYRARYTDAHGEPQDHTLALPNGRKVTDKTVAQSELTKILRRVEREAAGLTDPALANAAIPMRVVIAHFIRHLRRKNRTVRYIRQALSYNKKLADYGNIERLADFNESNIDKALVV